MTKGSKVCVWLISRGDLDRGIHLHATSVLYEMIKVTIRNSQMKVKKIKESLSQLNASEILEIDNLIHERLETEAMMKMAESGFSE